MPIVFRELGYADADWADGPYTSPLVFAQMGLQFTAASTKPIGLQFTSVIYNTKLLRIMSAFPSRGAVGVGNNAWGNSKGRGLNWKASSTQSGDFGVNNLNTDIVEQIWRSATGFVTGIALKCDTEIDQGVFTDTFSAQNHNLTSSAVVKFEGSTDSAFSVIGISITIQITPENLYWISPDLPLSGFRYWRVTIDDPTNPAGFLSIGTIIFGVAKIFVGEQNTDQLQFYKKDFADKVPTEGFTTVANSRSIKRFLHVEFKSMRTTINNYAILANLIAVYRTTQKSLWIPTPDPVDMRNVAAYSVFAKVPTLPVETHNYKGPGNAFADLAFDLDEAQ